MRKIIFTIIVFSSLTLFEVKISQAQWQPDVRLTYEPALSYTSNNNAWCIASSGDEVHAVWYDFRNGNFEIYYKRSPDGGLSWGADVRLTNNMRTSTHPSVAASGSVVHVVWVDNRDTNDQIYYKRSTDGGLTWGSDTRLTITSAFSSLPSVSVSGSDVHAVWQDSRNGGYEIYYKRSTNGGLNWQADLRLTINSAYSLNPSVSVSGSVVNVVWYDDRDGNYEIYYKRSPDGGFSWGADIRFTSNSAESSVPCVSASGSAVYVVWTDQRDGNYEIYNKRSTNGGLSWEADVRLTNNAVISSLPSVSFSGSVVHVVWMDERDGNQEIYYKTSPDGGLSWGSDIRLTNNPASSYNPSVNASGSVVNVVWQDDRDGRPQIYCKRNPTGNFQPPSAPFNLTALAVSYSRINLNWTDTLSSETGFKIQRSTNAGSNWILRDSVGQNIVAYADTGLTASTIYHYRVCAYNAVGNSPFSNIAFDTTFLAAPLAPNLISPLNGSLGQSLTPTLDWTDVSGAASYGVQVSIDSTFDSLVVNLTGLDSSQYTVPDNTLMNHTWYYWRANATNVAGTSPWSSVWNFETLYDGINTYSNEMPKEFKLYDNFPNPFNPVTKIRFDIPKATKVRITIYDLIGREVELLYDNILNPGKFEMTWNASDYPSGVYFYRLISDGFVNTKKMVLVK